VNRLYGAARVEDDEVALVQAMAFEVVGELFQALFVRLGTAPDFQLHDITVLLEGDRHVQAPLFRDLRLFESMALAVEDGVEERQEDQAVVALPVPRALSNLTVIRDYFGARQGTKKEHSHSYVTDEQRSIVPKEAEELSRYLVTEAL
jgi:hypothetical protein